MPFDLASVRLDNALRLFEEFVQSTVKHPDAATLRGLEGRFAERLGIQPSYWSQIKSRSRQIGERLARQFEQQCRKPHGWMDTPASQRASGASTLQAAAAIAAVGNGLAEGGATPADTSVPQSDEERFIVGLVLTYYRRHPQRARARLLDILGEVLVPEAAADPRSPAAATTSRNTPPPATPPSAGQAADRAEAELWARTRAGVAPLKRKR